MVNPDLSGLPAFSTPKPRLSSGHMILQVMVASLVSVNKILAHPASVDTIRTSANKEDHVSMGMASALKLHSMVDNLQIVLAGEKRAKVVRVDIFLDEFSSVPHSNSNSGHGHWTFLLGRQDRMDYKLHLQSVPWKGGARDALRNRRLLKLLLWKRNGEGR